MNALSRYQPEALGVLRIVTGLLFMQHGLQKLFGMLGGEPVELMGLMGLAGILEFVGGLLILLGLFTRPVAFLLAGEMAVAYFRSHFPQGFWPIVNRGELAALYCFVFLYFSTAGPGRFSLDGLIRRGRSQPVADAHARSTARTV
jgi:putative oxidoreductase